MVSSRLPFSNKWSPTFTSPCWAQPMSLTTLAQPARVRKPLFSGSPIAHMSPRVASGRFAALKTPIALSPVSALSFCVSPRRKIWLTSATSPGVGANGIITDEIDLWLRFPRSRPQPLVFVAAAYGGRFRVFDVLLASGTNLASDAEEFGYRTRNILSILENNLLDVHRLCLPRPHIPLLSK